MLPLRAREQVAGLREGGAPGPVDQARVPAHVIHVQVRADHRVDALGREAERVKIFQEGPLAPVPGGDGALLVVSHAGVHQDAAVAALDDERVDAGQREPVLRDVGAQPRDLGELAGGGVGQDEADVRRLQLLQAGDPDVADLPLKCFRHAGSPPGGWEGN